MRLLNLNIVYKIVNNNDVVCIFGYKHKQMLVSLLLY